MIEIRRFDDPPSMRAYHELRWELLRKQYGLPFGSEYYEGEERGIYIGAFDETFIGGAFLIDRGEHNAQMHQVVVREERQRQGIGSAIVTELERVAFQQEHHRVFANGGENVLGFYEYLGYAAIPDVDVPLSMSRVANPLRHIFMVKEL